MKKRYNPRERFLPFGLIESPDGSGATVELVIPLFFELKKTYTTIEYKEIARRYLQQKSSTCFRLIEFVARERDASALHPMLAREYIKFLAIIGDGLQEMVEDVALVEEFESVKPENL